MFRNNFGNRLRALRERKELAQGTIAGRLNLTQATYSRYESGVHQPDFDTLKKIANFFNVSIDYLLENDNNLYETEEIVDFNNFVMNGKYTISSKFPTERDRKIINGVINSIFKVDELP